MADCCETFLSFFFTSFCGREMSNGLTLTDLIISIWVACVAGALKEEWGGGGGVGSKKEKKEGGKKGEGIPSSLSYTPPPPPL